MELNRQWVTSLYYYVFETKESSVLRVRIYMLIKSKPITSTRRLGKRLV